MKRNPLTLIIGLLLCLVFVSVLLIFQVRQSEVAVVTTFGKPTRPITEPGPHVRLPWPIQKVYKFDQRVQNFEDKLTEGITRDSFNLLTSVYVGWKITEPTNFFPKFAGAAEPIAEAERLLGQRLAAVRSAVIGRHPLSDFLSLSDNGSNYLAIEQEILTTIQSQMEANNWGLQVEFLGIKKLQLPEQVTQAVFDRMQQERKVLAEKSQSEGEAEAQKIHSEADRRAAETLSIATGEALKIKGKGEAEAAKSLAVFQQNPALAKFIFRLNALEDSCKERTILVFDAHTPPFDLFQGTWTNLPSK
ncbi:Band 7 protein [Verrucomicrobia bacterium]|nr:Band 7 protein [Verrucomicrobiota bacterium]